MNVIRVNASDRNRDQVEALLPDNYRVVGTFDDGTLIVLGVDVLGWTATDYVIPRLASGLIPASLEVAP